VALPMIARNYSQAQEHGAHFTEIMLATAKCEVEKQGGGGKRGEELDAKGYNSMGVVPWASTRDRQLWKIDGSCGFFSPLNNTLTMQKFTLFDGSNFQTVVGC